MNKPSHFKEFLGVTLTKRKIIQFLISDVLGNFVGFAAGFLTTSMFTHYVYERKSIHNLYGLLGRKKVLVDDTPGWLSWCVSILVGFIVMETFRYLFYEGKYIIIWEKIRGKKKS